MKGALVIGLSVLAALGGLMLLMSSQDQPSRKEFLAFKRKYNKSYGSQTELDFRFKVYVSNMEMIGASNADRSKTYRLGENAFADMTFEEFKNMYLMKPQTKNDLRKAVPSAKQAVGQKDWRDVPGVVGPVKNQGQCGSCWAFSTVAAMEAAYYQKHGKFVSFSEQELVDCAGGKYHNQGCNGGLMPFAYMYIMDNQITTQEAYPYRAVQGHCVAQQKSPRYSISGFEQISPINVDGLMTALDKTVVSVAFEVQNDLMFYNGGVYKPKGVCGYALNHGVAAVGYDSTSNDPFFVVKNSWGAEWGEAGFFRMSIGTGSGTCGIANDTDTYPVLP